MRREERVNLYINESRGRRTCAVEVVRYDFDSLTVCGWGKFH